MQYYAERLLRKANYCELNQSYKTVEIKLNYITLKVITLSRYLLLKYFASYRYLRKTKYAEMYSINFRASTVIFVMYGGRLCPIGLRIANTASHRAKLSKSADFSNLSY